MADQEVNDESDGATSTGSEDDGTQDDDVTLGDAGKKALDAIRAEKKAAEKRAKDLESELDELRRSQMSDQEKAIDEARSAARSEALAEVGAKVAVAEFKAAASGRLDDGQVKTLLSGLDLKAFLDSDGDVDPERVSAFVNELAPKANGSAVDFGQGARSGSTALNGDPLLRDLQNKLGIG